MQLRTPECSHSGLGSSHFARRYSGNHCCFLFLRLRRCFSSPGSPRMPMDSVHGGWGFPSRVSPFRYLRIVAHVQLPAAFRSLSRLSSALSAKASTLCSWLLNHPLFMPSVALLGFFPSSRKLLPAPGEGLSFLPVFRLPECFRIPLNLFFENVLHSLASDVLYISFLQTLILKILIQYSVFKVQ